MKTEEKSKVILKHYIGHQIKPEESAQPLNKSQEKFWTYESGKATIHEEKLYDYLYQLGYRYYKAEGDNIKFIVKVLNTKLEVYPLQKVWNLCSLIIDNEFKSVADDERTKAKEAIKEIRKSLKKGKLVRFTDEDLANCENSGSKTFLLRQNVKYKNQEGGAS